MNIGDWVKAVAGGQAVFDELHDGVGDGLGGGAFDEEEVAGFARFEIGEIAAIDGVGAGDDAAGGGLAEDFGELDTGDAVTGDGVLEDFAGADAGELIGIADEEELSAFWEGGEELGHEGGVDHGDFIEDKDIALQRSAAMAAPLAVALRFEQAVEGFGFESGAVLEAACGAAGGCGEHDFFVCGLVDAKEAADEGGFADAGTAGDDEDALTHGGVDGVALAVCEGELLALLGGGDGMIDLGFGTEIGGG